jgi:hypothetical protein
LLSHPRTIAEEAATFRACRPTFKRIVRNGSTEQFSAMPYIYSLLNCLICMWYGLPFVSYGVVLVATVNSIGAAFQLAYTAVFIAFAPDAKQRVPTPTLSLLCLSRSDRVGTWFCRCAS